MLPFSEVDDDPQLLQLMLSDMAAQDGVYRPGPYWQAYTERIEAGIRRDGISRFRSNYSIGRGFADVPLVDPGSDGLGHRLAIAARGLARRKPVSTRLVDRPGNQAWIDAFLARFAEAHPLPDTLVGSPARTFSSSVGEVGELYLRDFAWIDDFASRIDFRSIRSVFEIGGGFGSMAHSLLHVFPNIRKYAYLDIPPVLYLGTQYLKTFYGSAVRDYASTRELTSIRFDRDTDALEIAAICPWQVEHLDGPFDLFWNSSSFQEMPEASIANYARHVGRLIAPDGVAGLFVYRGQGSEVSGDRIVEIFRETSDLQFDAYKGEAISHVLAGRSMVSRPPTDTPNG